jgi:AcrR family transcriptional regulator
MGRTGRRAENSAETKAQILEAARGVFATLGYDGTTMRRIAVDSGVDSTLISHYFGTKQELFVAVHELPINPSDPALLIDGPDDEIGERVALFAVTMLATDDSTAVSLMRSSVSSPSATTMLRQFIEKALIDPIAEPIGGSDARERVALTATQILDVLFARHIVHVPELAAATAEDLVDSIGPVLQRYLTEPLH